MEKTINFFFSIGYRCTTVEFLTYYKLRKISGPFDYIFIDIETAFSNINNNFNTFLSDLVHINKYQKKCKMYYSDKIVNEQLLDFIENENIGYISCNYNNIDLFINQNFIDNIHYNIYYWNRCCIFRHHNLLDKNIYNTINKRVNIFKNIYNNLKKNVCLLYIDTQKITNFSEYKKKIFNLKKKYNINCYIIIIIYSKNLNDDYTFDNDILYIIKNLDSSCKQNDKSIITNGLNYNKEYNIINEIFNIKLMTHEQIKLTFK